MQKRILHFLALISLCLVYSCYSAKTYYEKGDYDNAIILACKKLRKKPDDQKTIDILVNSWEISNRVDKENLNQQLNSENPDWERVFALYTKLDNRQKNLMQLPKLRPSNPQSNVDFVFEDYSLALANSKQQAIDNLVKKGDEYMSYGDRFNARKAYDSYTKAYGYDNSNSNVRNKADQAKIAGMAHMLIQAAPANQLLLPQDFTTRILNRNWNKLESKWLQIHNIYQGNFTYHYFTDVLIQSVVVSPERVVETSYVDTKRIEDGWEYARNGDGTYKLDSLGNKIKVTVYRDIQCNVKKTTLMKEVTVNGMVMIYSGESDKKYANDPIYGNYKYEYAYGVAKGDTRALSNASNNLIDNRPGTFPTYNDMVMNVANDFGDAIYNKVNQYKNVFD